MSTINGGGNDAATSPLIGDPLSLQAHYSGRSVPIGATLFTLLRLCSICATALMTTLLLYLAIEHKIHLYMFTYWHLIMFTGFLWALTVGLFTEGWLLLVVVLFLLPVETGLTLIVSIAIVILICENPAILMDDTVYEGGALTMDIVHTADWLLHNLGPMLLYWGLFVAGLWLLGRTIVGQTWAHLKTPAQRLLVGGWFMSAPLWPLLVYSVALGIHKHYPTDVPDVVLWLAMLPIAFVIQGVVFLSFVLTSNVTINVPSLGDELERWTSAKATVSATLTMSTTTAAPITTSTSTTAAPSTSDFVLRRPRSQQHAASPPPPPLLSSSSHNNTTTTAYHAIVMAHLDG